MIPALCAILSAEPVLQPIPDLKPPSAGDLATKKRIESIGTEWWLKNRGLLAEESPRVAGYFYVFRSIKGFADRGDRVWEIRMIYLGTQCPTGVLWINEKSGKILGLGLEHQ
jgi:hypothetical protein